MFPLSIFCFHLLWYNLLNQAQTVQPSDQEHLHGDSVETLSAKEKNTSFKKLTCKQIPQPFYQVSPPFLHFSCWTVKNVVPLTDMTQEVTVKILDFQATSRPKNLTSLAYKTPVPETCEVDLWQFIKIPAQKHNNDLLFRTNCTKIIVIADCIHSIRVTLSIKFTLP